MVQKSTAKPLTKHNKQSMQVGCEAFSYYFISVIQCLSVSPYYTQLQNNRISQLLPYPTIARRTVELSRRFAVGFSELLYDCIVNYSDFQLVLVSKMPPGYCSDQS